MTRATYQLLDGFRRLFEGRPYLHRNASQGDRVARLLYEDLYSVSRSKLLCARIERRERVLNVANRVQGIRARRGDAAFGELVPNSNAVEVEGAAIARGPIATLEIGAEVKILAKAMVKQLDRVESDLKRQVEQFRQRGENPICIGIVGINHAESCVGYEGAREYRTDGKKNPHPIQEAAEAEARLLERAAPAFDEFLVLRYSAPNEPPFPFRWVQLDRTATDYGAILARVARKYDARFR